MYTSNNINVFALTNNINLRNKGIWIFGVDPQAQTEKVLSYALEKGSKNIAALLPQNAYGLLLFDTITSFAQTNLMKIEKIEFYNYDFFKQYEALQFFVKSNEIFVSDGKTLEYWGINKTSSKVRDSLIAPI